MDDKCIQEIEKAIKLLEISMEERDSREILLILKEVQGIFTEIWKKYIDDVLSYDKK